MNRSLRVALVLGACCVAVGGVAACATVLGFNDRSATWCAQRSHLFCEDFDDPSQLAQNWTPQGVPQDLIPTFEPASLPSAARLVAIGAGVNPNQTLNPGLGTAFISQPLPPDLFTNHTKLAIGVEAQLLASSPDAATFQGALPFAPLLFLLFVDETTGETVFGGIVLQEQDAGYWAAAGFRLIQPAGDASPEINVSVPTTPQLLQPGQIYGQNYVCACVTLTLVDGGLTTSASQVTIPALPTLNPPAPVEVLFGLVQAPSGTEIAIDNVTIDYDVDCDPKCQQ